MRRAIVCDRNGTALFDLPPAEVFEMVVREEVNGEHSLTVTTTRTLDKGWRILTQDDRGRWREHVVFGTDALHDAGERAFGTYYCTWSLQHDLMGTHVSTMPGVQVPCTAAVALDAALSGTSRWVRGTVTNTNTGGASMYDTDGWSAISIMVGTWGGEVDTTIEVDDISRTVTAREVDYYDAQGDQEPKRRYDFGADLSSVRRTIEDGPLYCRMSPRGKGEETEGGGYGRKITIESVNDGKDYLENPAMTNLAKLPNGSGGWEYPTIIAENSECETPAELKAWAEEVLEEYTVPKVTYDIDVVQLAREGVDIHGVSLGDAVHVVDRKLGDGMGIAARVLAATTNLLNEADVQLTLGHMNGGLAGIISGFNNQLATVSETVKAMNGGNYSTADYLERLVDRINTEINATGGYAYIVPGNGILCFDTAVADPLNPTEASQVVEIKGGSIRIANSKTAQGQWEWKTVFTSGHIAADLVTAANLISGTIGNATGDFFIDMDNAVFRMPAMTVLGDQTVDEIAAESTASAMANDENLFVDSGTPSAWPVYANNYLTARINLTENLVKGDEYTIRVWGSVSRSDTTAELLAYWGGGNVALATMTQNSDGTWSATFTAPNSVHLNTNNAFINLYIGPSPAGASGTTYTSSITKAKLQRGSEATKWTSSQQDSQRGVLGSTMVRAYGSGVLVCRQGNTVGALVNSDGSFDVVAVTWSDSTPTAGTVYATYGATAQIGASSGNYITVTNDGMEMFYTRSSTHNSMMKVGYQSTANKTFFTFGRRDENSEPGGYSFSSGYGNTASAEESVAMGLNCQATGRRAVALGNESIASGANSCAIGYMASATSQYQVAVGSHNASTAGVFIVGGGTTSTAKTAMSVSSNGDTTIAGTLTQNSDRRLKQHVAYLGDDANVIINRLKPAVFIKDGGRHYGFYAQDVQRADIWDTKTVEAQHTDESLDFDPLTLDYTALIAPLTAYAQSLEARIEKLEQALGAAYNSGANVGAEQTHGQEA